MKPKLFRITLIIFIAVGVLCSGGAFAAQHFGAPYDLVLGGTGRIYEQSLCSGYYIAGRDIPAGQYKVTVLRGSGTISAPDGGSVRRREAAAGTEFEITLSDHDRIDAIGVDIKLYCASTAAAVITVPPDPSLERGFTLVPTGDDGGTYTAGQDFPAGRYSIKALSGSGILATQSDGELRFDSAVKTGEENAAVNDEGVMLQFCNLMISEGDILTVNGVQLLFTPA